MTMQRRAFVQGAMAAGAAAIAAGLLTPHTALAAYPREAFRSQSIDDILSDTGIIDSADIVIKAPESIADDAAMVPIEVTSTLKDVEEIHVFVQNNPFPKVAQFNLGAGMQAQVICRVKMAGNSDVIAVVKAGQSR